MYEENWLNIISRISTDAPVDLDRLVFHDKASAVSNVPKVPVTMLTCHSSKLWEQADDEVSYIGVRVNQRPDDCTQAAFRLAAAALERKVTPIILTTLADSGFDRFGFRVERIVGETEADISAFEQELGYFWNLAIIIDISDVAMLG